MKTIKQVADALGVSRQAIYRRLSALPSEMLSADNKGVQLINTDGEAFLKNLLSENPSVEQSANSPDSPADNVADRFIDVLQKELDAKNNQLAEKDKQINELIASNKILSESIKAERNNALAETIIDGQAKLPPPKVSLWEKIFRGKGGQK